MGYFLTALKQLHFRLVIFVILYHILSIIFVLIIYFSIVLYFNIHQVSAEQIDIQYHKDNNFMVYPLAEPNMDFKIKYDNIPTSRLSTGEKDVALYLLKRSKEYQYLQHKELHNYYISIKNTLYSHKVYTAIVNEIDNTLDAYIKEYNKFPSEIQLRYIVYDIVAEASQFKHWFYIPNTQSISQRVFNNVLQSIHNNDNSNPVVTVINKNILVTIMILTLHHYQLLPSDILSQADLDNPFYDRLMTLEDYHP